MNEFSRRLARTPSVCDAAVGADTHHHAGEGDRILYAAYGSNLHPARLTARVPSAALRGSATVSGWALRFHKRGQDGSAKCDIVEADSAVHVAVYALSHADKRSLDRVEGVGRGYEVTSLAVPGLGECVTYVAQTCHIDTELQPFCWYRELVMLGARFHGFPARYIDAIAALSTRRDPDRERHTQHMSIVPTGAGRSPDAESNGSFNE